MTREEFRRLTENTVILDGAMGTNLYQSGLPRRANAEAWILEHPDVVEQLQSAYVEAGSRILYAPTFGANRNTLQRHGLEGRIREMNLSLVELSRKAAKDRALVAGDMSPTGLLLEDIGGEATEEEVFEIFREQAQILTEAGVDLIAAETMISVMEAGIALDAIRSVCDLPVMITLSVNENGRCIFGGTAVEGVEEFQENGADAVGINCSCGPDQLEQVVRDMKAAANVPLVVKPNAGIPVTGADGSAVYEMGADEFSLHMMKIKEAGATLVGGCCGTSPDYIRKLKLRLEGKLI